MVLQTWGNVVIASLQQAWTSVIGFVPNLLGALVIFAVGWVVAATLGQLVEQLIKALRVDQLLAKLEIQKVLSNAGWNMEISAFVGALVKWFLIIVFLLASSNILGLTQVSDFIKDVLLYLPNVVVSALILIIAALIADALERTLRGSAETFGYKGHFVGLVVRWAIWIFAIIAVLLQLGIAVTLVQTLVTGFVAALALATGLAFGLGGRDAAADIIQKIRNEVKK